MAGETTPFQQQWHDRERERVVEYLRKHPAVRFRLDGLTGELRDLCGTYPAHVLHDVVRGVATDLLNGARVDDAGGCLLCQG